MNKGLERVTVLLATYNGEEFIKQQLESLASQEGVLIEVHANDDGSKDGTIEILEQWRRKGLIKSISTSNRIGATPAFLNLLKKCSSSDYVAFCDQDDVWGSRKLITLLPLVKSEEPRLAICGREFIDEGGNKSPHREKTSVIPSFTNALVENIAPGNCSLINASAVELLNSFENPRVSHYDSWVYLNVVAYGRCTVIAEKLVSYRIHKGNLVGLRDYRFRSKLDSIESYFMQAKLFRESLGADFPSNKKKELDDFLGLSMIKSPIRRLLSIIGLQVNRQKRIDGLIFKILLVWFFRKMVQAKEVN